MGAKEIEAAIKAVADQYEPGLCVVYACSNLGGVTRRFLLDTLVARVR